MLRRGVCALALLGALLMAQRSESGSAPSSASASSGPVTIKAELDRGVLRCGTGEPTPVFLNLSLDGLTISTGTKQKAPLNVVFVLDKSGSMNGDDKWGYVRRALDEAFKKFGTDDYVSLVTYDTSVATVFGPTRNLDAAWASRKLAEIEPDGSTNLYGGLEQGAEMLREHLSSDRINRVILLSDGLANVGPSSTEELRALAERLSGNKVRISTIGVGSDYNEDLMLGVATDSGGAYYFIDEPRKIASIFQEELQGLMDVVARDIQVVITLPEGVRFRRSLDRAEDVKQEGRTITLTIPEVAAKQSCQLLLELELDAANAKPGVAQQLADVKAEFTEATGEQKKLAMTVTTNVSWAADQAESDASINKEIFARVASLQMIENREKAIQAMDSGNVAEAKQYYRANLMTGESVQKLTGAAPAVQAEMANTVAQEAAYDNKDENARKSSQYNAYKGKKK